MDLLDHRWLDEYSQVSGYVGTLEDCWRTPLAAQKEIFFSNNCQSDPDLRPEMPMAGLQSNHEALTTLQDQIGAEEPNDAVKSAYVAKLDELLLTNQMAQAAHTGDNEAYVEASTKAWGEPSAEVYAAVSTFIGSWALGQLEDSRKSHVKGAARQVLDVLPQTTAATDVWLSAEEHATLQSLFGNFLGNITDGVDLPDVLKGEATFTAASQILRNLGYPYTAVPQQPGSSFMEVKHAAQELRLPVDASYTRERFVALMGHEVGVHIEERMRGDEQPLRLLADGLAKYIRAGEGKGTLVEQVSYPTIEDFQAPPRFISVAQRCLAVGLARGVDGNGPRNLREVFQIVNAIDYLKKVAATPEDKDGALTRSRQLTWSSLAGRIMRGSTGRGAVRIREKEYIEGSVVQGRLLLSNPDVYPYLNLGKYDLTQPDHVDVLRAVGTLPRNLVIAA
jgi:hypothetical protein